jgi:hypothetical protein
MFLEQNTIYSAACIGLPALWVCRASSTCNDCDDDGGEAYTMRPPVQQQIQVRTFSNLKIERFWCLFFPLVFSFQQAGTTRAYLTECSM